MAHLEVDVDVGHRVDEGAQLGQRLRLDVGAPDLQAFQLYAEVVVVLRGEGLVEEQQLAELLGHLQLRHDLLQGGHHREFVHPFRAHGREAVRFHVRPHEVKTNLLFKSVGV